LSRNDIFKRIEEDRERHKRLRERRWVQPVSHTSHHQLPPLASFLPFGDQHADDPELPIDIEFENEWETTSNWNEDDDEAAGAENSLCFPPSGSADDSMMIH
jgi:CTD kinase subunit gamma